MTNIYITASNLEVKQPQSHYCLSNDLSANFVLLRPHFLYFSH